jgi:hypothetical protein
MSRLALHDSVGSLHDNAETYREGREALEQLSAGRDWSDWQKVGAALAAGRTEAMRIANTNRPKGRKYNRAFGEVLKREQLGTDRLDSATRNQLLRIVKNQSPIEKWRETLAPAQRLKLNHPSAVWRNWQRTVKGSPRDEQSKGSRAIGRGGRGRWARQHHRGAHHAHRADASARLHQAQAECPAGGKAQLRRKRLE